MTHARENRSHDLSEHDEARLDRTGHAKKQRKRRILLAAPALVLVPAVAGGSYLAWLNHVVTNNVTQEPLLDLAAKPTDARGRFIAQPADNGTNYLLIGKDTRPGETASRSDLVVLVHVPQDRSKVQLIHLPRDLAVSIPGHKKDKLNAAYTYGGAPLLVKTVQNLLGIEVDHAGVLGFEALKRVTDAVGGVDVKIEEPTTSNGFTFTTGTMHLNGEMALALLRDNKQVSQGEGWRGNQQALLKALMRKALSKDVLLNPARFASLVDAGTSKLAVDQRLSASGLRAKALDMRDLRGGDIRFITAPVTSGSKAGQPMNPDGAKLKQLGDALRNDAMDSYK